ncbi:Mft1p SCDLUD_004330 [Saccharomycodes ludwigii]|uniref:Mft1p n=1 Tax=Saccharomycodes ludwigii TaxID=36035 RepID=UPI001E860AE9|nr:hypothetical protein SCDLUD_004330 [Saccharomycodes ludwigii]KAH3900013.1 hypothetical protein SCDLUD_004330 [Saccharomycodes ludwigii]
MSNYQESLITKKLEIYNPSTELKDYINVSKRISNLLDSLLKGDLKEEDNFNSETITKLNIDLSLKYQRAHIFLDRENIKSLESSDYATTNSERVITCTTEYQEKLKENSIQINKFNNNAYFKNADIKSYNEELALLSHPISMELTRSKMEELYGKELFQKIFKKASFSSPLNKRPSTTTSNNVILNENKQEQDANYPIRLLIDKPAAFYKDRCNVMKKKIKKVTFDASVYKDKWEKDNAAILKIQQLLDQEKQSRRAEENSTTKEEDANDDADTDATNEGEEAEKQDIETSESHSCDTVDDTHPNSDDTNNQEGSKKKEDDGLPGKNVIEQNEDDKIMDIDTSPEVVED